MRRAALPWRLARREVWRRPGRTALVALLVALPVGAMTMSVVLFRTDHATPDEMWQAQYGTADAVAFGIGRRVADEAPEGSRVVAVERAFFRVRTADGLRAEVEISDHPLGDPITTGIFELRDGRPPEGPGEVALSPSLARRFGVGVGDQLELDRPALAFEVVGLAEKADCISCGSAVVAAGEVPTSSGRPDGLGDLLIDLPPLSTTELVALGAGGTQVRALQQVIGDDAGSKVRWTLVLGAVALTVMGIVISAAFAVGARRQLVTMGQLSANGAPPSTLRWALVLQGTLTGVVGAAIGILVAAVLLTLLEGRFEAMLDHRIASYDVRAFDMVAVVAAGVVAATVAALVPARTAARIPTLAALAGRRPLTPVSGRLVARGFGAFGLGLGLLGLAVVGSDSGTDGTTWALVAIAGGVIELLGACAIAPAVVARLEPLSGRVRGSWRLAARSLARQRTRTGAVVSAVAAAGALAVCATALVRGAAAEEAGPRVPPDVVVAWAHNDGAQGPGFADRRKAGGIEPPTEAVQRELERILSSARTSEVRIAVPADGLVGVPVGGDRGAMVVNEVPFVLVGDRAVLDALQLPDAVTAALGETGWAFVGSDVTPGPVEVGLPDGSLVAASAVRSSRSTSLTPLVATRAAVDAAGLDVTPAGIAYETPEPLTADQRNQLDDLQDELLSGPEGFVILDFHRPDNGPSPFQVELILTGIVLVFAVFVVGAGLALAAAESRDERDVLTVVGAPPPALARTAGAKAWLLAAIGGLMAVPVGFLPVAVFTRADDGTLPLVFPGRTVLALALLVPAVAGLVALATSAAAQRLRPVRISTATFE